MKTSIVGFKISSADLHRKSPLIFILSLILSVLATMAVLTAPLPERKVGKRKFASLPVIIHLQNIPKTRHVVTSPAPPRPVITSGTPVESDEILPDDITIEDTSKDIDNLPPAPLIDTFTETGAAEEENEIFEYYAVEEPPVPVKSVVPEYPPMAERGNIEGTVFLRLLVDTTGTVDSVVVEKGPKIFYNSAIKAAKASKFKPAKQNDRPVACWVIIPFRYILQ